MSDPDLSAPGPEGAPPAPADSTPTPPAEKTLPLIWVGWWVTLVTVSDQAMISPLLPNLLEHFQVEVHQGGRITGSYFLGAAAMVLLAGVLADRIGCRTVLALSIALVAVGELGSGLAESFPLFLIARTLVGAGSAAAALALTTYIGLHISYGDRGRVMGMIGTAFFLGNTLGPFAVTQIVDRIGLSPLFLSYSFLALVGIVHSEYALRKDPPHEQTAGSIRDYLPVLRSRPFWGIVIVQSLFTFGVMGMIQYFGQWLETTHGLDTRARGLVFLVGGLPILIGSPIGGWISDRTGKKPFMVGVTLLLAVVTCILPYIDESYTLVILFFGAVGFAVAGRYAAYHALATRLIGEELLGHFLALRNFLNYLAAASGVMLMGYVYDSSATSGYIRMGWVTALLLVLSLPVLVRMIPGEPRRESL